MFFFRSGSLYAFSDPTFWLTKKGLKNCKRKIKIMFRTVCSMPLSNLRLSISGIKTSLVSCSPLAGSLPLFVDYVAFMFSYAYFWETYSVFIVFWVWHSFGLLDSLFLSVCLAVCLSEMFIRVVMSKLKKINKLKTFQG